MNPYEVLGVRADASAAEIREAFVRLARQHHPDYHLDATATERAEAERRMRAVNDAWALIGEAQRRHRYDDEHARPFRPFTPSIEDEPDPRDAPDVPYRPVSPPTARDRALTLAPAMLFGSSVAVGALSAVIQVPALFGLAFLLFVFSCIGFLVIPLLALGRARRDEG